MTIGSRLFALWLAGAVLVAAAAPAAAQSEPSFIGKTINLTIGYAFNPHPRKELGQGRGALFFNVTYTNLFR